MGWDTSSAGLVHFGQGGGRGTLPIGAPIHSPSTILHVPCQSHTQGSGTNLWIGICPGDQCGVEGRLLSWSVFLDGCETNVRARLRQPRVSSFAILSIKTGDKTCKEQDFYNLCKKTRKMISKIQRSTQFQGLGSIDVHHHCFPETVAELRSEFQDNKYGIAFTDFPVKPEEHLSYMDEVGVQTAVIVSYPCLPVEVEN